MWTPVTDRSDMTVRRQSAPTLVTLSGLLALGLIAAALRPPVAHAAALVSLATSCTPGQSCVIDSSGGSLDHIVVGADTTLQVIYPSLSADHGQIFPPGAGLNGSASCSADSGFWVNIGGTLYGPDFSSPIHCAGTATSNVQPDVVYTPVSQVASGSGTSVDPYVVVTTVSLSSTASLVQRLSYVPGDKYVAQSVTLIGSTPLHATIFNGTDIYLLGSDRGFGYYDPSSGAIGGRNVTDASGNPASCGDSGAQPGSFYELEVPYQNSPAQHYTEAGYSAVWANINASKSGGALSDTVDTTVCEDNGAALEWDNVATGTTISDALSFNLGGAVIPPTPTNTPTPVATDTVVPTASNTPAPAVSSTPTTGASTPEMGSGDLLASGILAVGGVLVLGRLHRSRR